MKPNDQNSKFAFYNVQASMIPETDDRNIGVDVTSDINLVGPVDDIAEIFATVILHTLRMAEDVDKKENTNGMIRSLTVQKIMQFLQGDATAEVLHELDITRLPDEDDNREPPTHNDPFNRNPNEL